MPQVPATTVEPIHLLHRLLGQLQGMFQVRQPLRATLLYLLQQREHGINAHGLRHRLRETVLGVTSTEVRI